MTVKEVDYGELWFILDHLSWMHHGKWTT